MKIHLTAGVLILLFALTTTSEVTVGEIVTFADSKNRSIRVKFLVERIVVLPQVDGTKRS
ncbi:MAG: hypothetical protein JRJ42_07425 [Deltaproteobacteria bacterium]|nr:hypothetical protein [Deltaproteobacteria bacterium]MBW2020104.1 hypothetical protein [Deltaproteobacteria bacterium]MBW2074741.1 hypothetical protein [Deltaproteobacteria bacterium]RLB80826.1 MAG: hypothetical protein DRH17_10940 [Deltaproteobacteria bacterium]